MCDDPYLSIHVSNITPMINYEFLSISKLSDHVCTPKANGLTFEMRLYIAYIFLACALRSSVICVVLYVSEEKLNRLKESWDLVFGNWPSCICTHAFQASKLTQTVTGPHRTSNT